MGLGDLTPELLLHTISDFERGDLINMRLTSKFFARLGGNYLFESITFGVDNKSILKLEGLASHQYLSSMVKKLTFEQTPRHRRRYEWSLSKEKSLFERYNNEAKISQALYNDLCKDSRFQSSSLYVGKYYAGNYSKSLLMRFQRCLKKFTALKSFEHSHACGAEDKYIKLWNGYSLSLEVMGPHKWVWGEAFKMENMLVLFILLCLASRESTSNPILSLEFAHQGLGFFTNMDKVSAQLPYLRTADCGSGEPLTTRRYSNWFINELNGMPLSESPLQELFSNLTHLDVLIDDFQEYIWESDRRTADQQRNISEERQLQLGLLSTCRNLYSVKLFINFNYGSTSENLRATGLCLKQLGSPNTWPKLKSLEVYLRTTYEDLRDFFNAFSSTLQNVRWSGHLYETYKDEVFELWEDEGIELFAAALPTLLPNLKHWEYSGCDSQVGYEKGWEQRAKPRARVKAYLSGRQPYIIAETGLRTITGH